MNMRGRPDLAMNRVKVSFPEPDDTILLRTERVIAFGYKIAAASGEIIARGVVTEDGFLHNYRNGHDDAAEIPEVFDVRDISQSVAIRAAKQCVAMVLCDYDPVNPGLLVHKETATASGEFQESAYQQLRLDTF